MKTSYSAHIVYIRWIWNFVVLTVLLFDKSFWVDIVQNRRFPPNIKFSYTPDIGYIRWKWSSYSTYTKCAEYENSENCCQIILNVLPFGYMCCVVLIKLYLNCQELNGYIPSIHNNDRYYSVLTHFFSLPKKMVILSNFIFGGYNPK